MLLTRAFVALSCIAVSEGTARVEGNCIQGDTGLAWLAGMLSSESAISCLGQPLQQYNANKRYWGTQFGKNASVVVFPGNTKDTSYTVRAANRSPFGRDFAFVGGGHGQVNASSAYGFVVDLSWLNKTKITYDFTSPSGKVITAVSYQGGANCGQVQKAVNGSGYTPICARVSNVGAGGFSLGGGIGFLAGAYGYAIDRLVQLEVVLPSGQIVLATKDNGYSDLFWAFQGGSGQFGIVTTFWQEAALQPKSNTIGYYFVDEKDQDRLLENTVDFFKNNQDPYSVVYYSIGYMPGSLDTTPAPSDFAIRTLLIAFHYEDPDNPDQLSYDDTFADLVSGINTTNGGQTSVPYADLVGYRDSAYPYGFRRGFYGPQVTIIDKAYLANLTDTFTAYIKAMLSNGDQPFSASFTMQYMFPGLNGHLPKKDSSTAWPHSVAGHQTLFAPAYLKVSDDALTLRYNVALNQISYDRQAQLGEFLADYPNYISPDATGHRVWGDNVERLIEIKQKYDPHCLIRNGRVFASPGCIARGHANVFREK